MNRKRGVMKKTLIVFVLAYVAAVTFAVHAQQASADGPRYTNGNQLVRPSNYREWIFLGAGLDMTYNEPNQAAAAAPDRHRFTNVFVNPSSYRRFLDTGAWPDVDLPSVRFRGSDLLGVDLSASRAIQVAIVVFVKFNHGHDASSAR